jgi:hypothetical protein
MIEGQVDEMTIPENGKWFDAIASFFSGFTYDRFTIGFGLVLAVRQSTDGQYRQVDTSASGNRRRSAYPRGWS